MGWMVVTTTARWLQPVLLAWQLSGHPDGAPLAAAARDYNVPPSLMWAVAGAETRHSIRNVEVSRRQAVGRMQVLPRVWYSKCGRAWGPHRYTANIRCGALILRVYLSRCNENVRCAAWHYVGGDSSYARRVAQQSLLYELKAQVGP